MKARFGERAKWLFRIGSSLNPEWMRSKSDIDYLAVMDVLEKEFVRNFPGRTSPELPAKAPLRNVNFYWRMTVGTFRGHPVNVTIYTTLKFLRYCEERSPPKMYLLHEHLLLSGLQTKLEALKARCKPDRETALQDLRTLRNPKYAAMWPWAWRSVAVLREDRWLRNKVEIVEWVAQRYPNHPVTDKKFLEMELSALVDLAYSEAA